MNSVSKIIFLFLFIAGCTSSSVEKSAPVSAVKKASSVGRFFHAGPTNADGDVLSTKWLYGFQFYVEPLSITGVQLSCPSIPGTMLFIDKGNLNINSDGRAFWYGETLPVSEKSTAWLFDPATTKAVCEAIISRSNNVDSIERAPVTFSGTTKKVTLIQMEEAYKHNQNLKKK